MTRPHASQGVRAAALALLARRDFATAELRERLERRGFERALIEAAVAELIEEHALDDQRFAQSYVAYRAGRGEGPLRIAAELRVRGLAAELIEAALQGGPDWHALARDVRRRRFGLQDPTSWGEKSRQARFLQYRGFSSDHIRAALGADLNPEDGS